MIHDPFGISQSFQLPITIYNTEKHPCVFHDQFCSLIRENVL